jgi:pyruvate/2-oxoglutarate/acetoin dehydrogenase E1 component
MTAYFDALCAAMGKLAADPRTVFIGQTVAYPGTAMFKTLQAVPPERKIELPVAEDMQMGMAIGLSLEGLIPVCIYPRWNFLLCATNQLVNHLDKLPLYSGGGYRPKVIIRTAVATDQPLDPGPQHLGDFSEAFGLMLKTVAVHRLKTVDDIHDYYACALDNNGPAILVEDAALY